MSQQNETGILSIVAGAARSAFLRVYNSSGTWTVATDAIAGQGVQQYPSLTTTEYVAIKSCSAPGTRKMTASGIIAVGGTCYAAADGKIAATGTIIEGIALEAAGADGDIIEVLPLHNTDVSVASTGTTATYFTVDSDSAAAKLKLDTAGCTGAFTMSLALPASLGQSVAVTFPDPGGATATVDYVAFAQTISAIKTHSADIILTNGTDLALGTTSDALLRFSTADASNPCLVLAVDDISQQIHITDKAAVATDWNRSAGTHPELAIHSNTTPITDYMAIGNHDGTTCYIDNVGGTTVSVKIAGTQCAAFTAGSAAAAALTLTGGITGPTSTLSPMIPIGANAAVVAPTAAIPVTNYMSWLDSTAGATTQTLADGVVRGQIKRIQAVHANDDVVTVANLTGGTTITFTNVGEYVVLLWTGAAWVVINSGNELLGTNVGPAVA